MRAGSLDRTITIQSRSIVEDDEGEPVDTWVPVATVRARIAEASNAETQVTYDKGGRTRLIGDGGTASIVFRLRFLPDVTPDNRVVYEDRTFDVGEVREIGRRRGLELRCEELPT